MDPITISIPHKLGKAEARARLEAGFGRMRAQIGGGMMNFNETWSGDTLAFSAQGLGQTVRGRMDVRDDCVRIEIDLPAFLVGIANAIKGRVQREATILLEDKRPKK